MLILIIIDLIYCLFQIRFNYVDKLKLTMSNFKIKCAISKRHLRRIVTSSYKEQISQCESCKVKKTSSSKTTSSNISVHVDPNHIDSVNCDEPFPLHCMDTGQPLPDDTEYARVCALKNIITKNSTVDDPVTISKSRLDKVISEDLNEEIINDDVGLPIPFSSQNYLLASQENNILTTAKLLQNWIINYRHQLSEKSINDLLQLLKSEIPHLPKDCRTFLITPATCQYPIKNVDPGIYCHFGIERGITKLLNSSCHKELPKNLVILLDINIDGLPLSKSSTSQFWPILLAVCNDNVASQDPFPAGIYYGHKKPNSVQEYMESFVKEFKKLETDGFLFNNQIIKVKADKLLCDAPAKSYILCTKGHTGYSSCSKCIAKGESTKRRISFSKFTFSQLRTDQDFTNKTDENYHLKKDGHFVISPLENLDIGLISAVPLDWMHLILLGVMKRLIKFWVHGKKREKSQYSNSRTEPVKLPEADIENMSKQILEMKKCIPSDFARHPRRLQEIDHYKATELRQFLLYIGPIVARHITNKKIYNNFMALHCAVRILCDSQLYVEQNAYAHKLLAYFIRTFSTIYGSQYVSHNVHGLIHVPADCLKHGTLNNISCFKFENYLQQIKKQVKRSQHPLQQFANRYTEKEQQSCEKLMSNNDNNCLVRTSTQHEKNSTEYSEIYNKIRIKNFEVSTKKKDNCVLLTDRSVFCIDTIHASYKSENVYFTGKQFKVHKSLYDVPFSSGAMFDMYESTFYRWVYRNTTTSYLVSHLMVVPSMHIIIILL